jgi:hypothetical protein
MSQPYNVFISWSGERSRVVAQKLREWLPIVVQTARPWMSDADIAKGSRGLSELTKALFSIKVGIVCLSPENLETPWLLFEAGALSKTIDDSSRLCTYLLAGLEPEDVKPPLGMFQATKATKHDSRRLVQTISVSVSEEPLGDEELDQIFEAMWPSLEATIKSLPQVEPAKSVKRKSEDMIVEILEIVRAEANRRQAEPMRSYVGNGITPTAVDAIKEVMSRQEKFLGEIVSHATLWEMESGELRLHFNAKNRALGEMLQAAEPTTRLRAIARKVLGVPVEVRIISDGAPQR